ncbi:MAG TPA: hypothetical protein VHZ78_15730 [Rhizomicrobium sp.]|jgi:hypothetical protein|nr:hypothetical protein [Rhizomicrobium sp.]
MVRRISRTIQRRVGGRRKARGRVGLRPVIVYVAAILFAAVAVLFLEAVYRDLTASRAVPVRSAPQRILGTG